MTDEAAQGWVVIALAVPVVILGLVLLFGGIGMVRGSAQTTAHNSGVKS